MSTLVPYLGFCYFCLVASLQLCGPFIFCTCVSLCAAPFISWTDMHVGMSVVALMEVMLNLRSCISFLFLCIFILITSKLYRAGALVCTLCISWMGVFWVRCIANVVTWLPCLSWVLWIGVCVSKNSTLTKQELFKSVKKFWCIIFIAVPSLSNWWDFAGECHGPEY